MIFGIKKKSFWPIQCIVGYYYKYIRATYDWFVLQGHKYKIKLKQYLLQTLSLPLPAALSLS